MKVIYIFVLILMTIFGGNNVEIQSDLVKCMSTPDSIIVYNQNNKTNINSEDAMYDKITDSILEMCNGSREMPAFGVALDIETKEALKTGLWIELVYSDTQEYNDMPFDTLLIEVEKDYTGFNIIRKQNNKYDGRCFYLALDGDMSRLYNTLTK